MECLFGGKVERCPLCFNLTRMFKKTGSRLKPPHRIVTDPAGTPVGRDDTFLVWFVSGLDACPYPVLLIRVICG